MNMKTERWRQPTPAMQAIAIISAIEGNIMNASECIISPIECEQNVRPLLDDLKKLSQWCRESWEI